MEEVVRGMVFKIVVYQVFSGSTYEGSFDCAEEEIKCEISFHCLAGLGEIKRYGYVVLWDIKDRH